MYIMLSFLGFLASLVCAFIYGASFKELLFVPLSFGASFPTIFCMFTIAYLALYVRAFYRRLKQGKSLKEASEDVAQIVDSYLKSGRIVDSIPLFVAVMIIMTTIPVMKSLIAYVHPYHLDIDFIKIDKWIHFGQYPQYLLAPIIEKLGLIGLLNYSYNFWLGVMLGGYWYAIFIDRNEHRRLTFLWCSLIAWFGMGWGLATSMSSVGPIFFGATFPEIPDPYAPYIEYLRGIHESGTMISSLWVSDLLGQMARDNNVIDLNGISAMPSMHVAIAALFAVYMWHVNKIWGVLYIVFAAIIMAGSIFLAWHYAIDGYFSIICVLCLWYVTGFILKKRKTAIE